MFTLFLRRVTMQWRIVRCCPVLVRFVSPSLSSRRPQQPPKDPRKLPGDDGRNRSSRPPMVSFYFGVRIPIRPGSCIPHCTCAVLCFTCYTTLLISNTPKSPSISTIAVRRAPRMQSRVITGTSPLSLHRLSPFTCQLSIPSHHSR